MSVTLNYTQIFAGTEASATAPLLMSALTPPTFDTFLDGAGWQSPTANPTTGLYGGRVTFATSKNFTARKYIQFSIMTQTYSPATPLATVSNGGMRILFVDGSGNFAGWSIYGSGMTGYDPDSGDGWFSSYRAPTDPTLGQEWLIDRLRAPDYSSGTINWSAVTAVEIHANIAQVGAFGSWGVSMYLRWLGLFDGPTATGTSDFLEYYTSTYTGNYSEWAWKRSFPRVGYQHYGLAGLSFSPKADFNIGDGTTPTTFHESNFAIGFWNLFDDNAQAIGPQVQLDTLKNRAVRINQSATDSATFADGVWSSSSGWSLTVLGNSAGVATFTRNTFVRAETVIGAHGVFTSCIFNGCKQVSITASTGFTGATIINADGEGLRLTGAPGNYSTRTVTFSAGTGYDLLIDPSYAWTGYDLLVDPSYAGTGYDLLIDPSSAGTFNFSGITVDPAYTLKVRNLSATHSITVQLPTGMLYTASTAGGTITIDAPAIVATASVIGMTAGSRLQVYNVTTDTEVVNAVQAGTSWSLEYANGTTFSSGDIVRIRCTYQSGVTAKLGEQYTAIPSTAGFTQLISLQADTIYNSYGVDGSTCTEFSWDGGNLQVDINDTDNSTVIQRIGAWYSYHITTAIGVNALFGGILWDQINAVKIVSTVVSLQLDNLKTTPLLLKGGRIYRTDGLTVIASASNSIQLDYDPVYMVETGVSGLTPAESAQLTTASSYGTTISAIKIDTGLIPATL